MSTSNASTGSSWRRRTTALGLVAAGAVAGGILAGTLSASADGSSTAKASADPGFGNQQFMGGMPTHSGNRSGPGDMRGHLGGSSPVRDDEKALSSDNAAKVKAAAEKAVPGGTVYRVETDAGDGAYEAHMTKSDGTPVTVKLDKNMAVTKLEDGMGAGDPGPAQHPGDGNGT